MGYIEGLLGGFVERKGAVEAENIRQAELANAREGKVFEALVNSSDPEIRSMAITGLLDSARPAKRKSGLRGWVGEMEASPMLPRIQALLQTPVAVEEETVTPGLPSRQTQGFIGLPPGSQPAAMVDGSAVTSGGPPVASQLRTENVAGPSRGRVDTQTVMRPREVFRTPEDQTLLTRKAQAQGDVEGEVAGLIAAGYTDVEARDLVKQNYARKSGVGASPFQAIAGEIVNADGSVRSTYAVFDRVSGKFEDAITGEPLPNFRRASTSTAVRFGVDRESIARSTYGKDFRDLDQTQAQQVMAIEQERARAMSSQRALGTEQGQFQGPIDVSTAQRTGTQVGTSSAQYQGQRVPSAQERARVLSAGTIKTQLTEIKSLLGILPKQSDVIGGLFPGAVLAKRRITNRTEVAQLESAINNIRAALTRTMQSNVGTETERDAERALTTLVNLQASLFNPTGGDTQESAAARIAETEKYLEEVMATLPGLPSPAPAGTVGTPPPAATAAPAPAPQAGTPPPATARPATPAAGPTGYTVDDAGRLLLNGQPVQ